MSRLIIPIALLLIACIPQRSDAQQADVIVYGNTSAGVIAAVQAAKMKRSVILVGPDRHLGGLSSGGLGWTDSGRKETVGGLARDFYHRIWQHYDQNDAWTWQKQSDYGNRGQGSAAIDADNRTMWIFEPHVAEQVFEDLIAEHKIQVFRDEWLDRETGVDVVDGQITQIRTLSGKTFRGKRYIDATYEGDLMAAAGVDYHVGREANDVYQEKWNGVQVGVLHHKHWFDKPIDPYIVPGDPSSGVLPLISTDPPGVRGEGDDRVQAYCFRMCLTDVAENRLPFPQPDGYDAKEYELLKRVFDAGWRDAFKKFDPIPNRKTDTNNHGPFSTDNIGMNYDYPDGSYQRRREIIAQHEAYQKGLMYFIANDPSVPAKIQQAMKKWGLPKDEFKDNGGWPHQIYVREARRMIGTHVMTEHDCMGVHDVTDSVGMGSYTMDSHNVQRYIKPDGTVQNEGDIGVHPGRPYRISYGSLVPKKSQCTNLLVPVCISSSHIAFGSIRMEPVFMILGQSAATAAILSIDQDIAVQDLDYQVLKKQLDADRQVLQFDGPFVSNGGMDPSKFPGQVLDDSDAKKSGLWRSSHSVHPFVGEEYLHDNGDKQTLSKVTWTVDVPKPGKYEVRISYTANRNRSTKVPVRIDNQTVLVNQRKKPQQRSRDTHDGIWHTVGTFPFANTATIEISNANADDGHVIVDAVQLIRVK
ncbi:FAD-dependent oxidoreductase [Planctomycetes bacterium K23_9]|uniref:Xanthan lyase n=1 Tax=Stieleria marina TaxID=1930275 RepID=A0A517NV10_9BACT|nr:Xanthan lyase precursor [Planctomycetes bacterium K23_9]